LQRECLCAVPTSDSKTCVAAKFVRIRHYAALRRRCLLFAILLECWLQVCRVKITFELLAAKFVRIRHYAAAAAFFLQVPNTCTDLDLTLLCTSILRTYQRHTSIHTKNKMIALRRRCLLFAIECWLQVCRVKITFELLQSICFFATKCYSNRFVCSVCFCSRLVLFWTFCTASPARY